MIAVALRLVAAVRNGALLVHRPSSKIVHLYRGAVTPSGRWVPRAGRTVCHAHTRRLSVLEATQPRDLEHVLTGGRRLCRKCIPGLPAALGVSAAVDLVNRDDLAVAYASLTVADVRLAGRWARTTDESHQVGRLAMILFGDKTSTPPARRTPAEAELAEAYDAIYARRRILEAAERSPEDQSARDHVAEARAQLDAQLAANHQKSQRLARAVDRRTRNEYLTPTERELLGA